MLYLRRVGGAGGGRPLGLLGGGGRWEVTEYHHGHAGEHGRLLKSLNRNVNAVDGVVRLYGKA